MGQRTRMGRAKTKGVPISRRAYREQAEAKQKPLPPEEQRERADDRRRDHPLPEHNTVHGTHTGPKTTKATRYVAPALPAYRAVEVTRDTPEGPKTSRVWRLIAALAGR
jgi:hypothetical protein